MFQTYTFKVPSYSIEPVSGNILKGIKQKAGKCLFDSQEQLITKKLKTDLPHLYYWVQCFWTVSLSLLQTPQKIGTDSLQYFSKSPVMRRLLEGLIFS